MKSKYSIFSLFVALIVMLSCRPSNSLDVPMPVKNRALLTNMDLDDETYHDKILGAIVGSAIGDAMGTSTEMWHRDAIQQEYGYINGLTTALREKSPEGTWRHNMEAGATTDDTRWKMLMGAYFKQHRNKLTLDNFAQFISNYYEDQVKKLSQKDARKSTDVLDEKIEQLNWIKEWARVTMAYQKGGGEFYKVQNRFYGGEMSCAGMLYTPMFGLVESTPEQAYKTAFEHALFDIGYARDISGLVAAMTNMAMQTNSVDSILTVHHYVDPYEYKNARLIGRLSAGMIDEAKHIIAASQDIELKDSADINIPFAFPGSKTDWMRQDFVYKELEKRQKAIAFHAGEIWQILITGLWFGEGDFQKTMAFIVNYGRDNDTVAAVAGMILGAQLGFDGLPEDLKQKVIAVSKNVVGIDLESLAIQVKGELKH